MSRHRSEQGVGVELDGADLQLSHFRKDGVDDAKHLGEKLRAN